MVRLGFLLGIAVALIFLAASVVFNWREVSQYNWEVNPVQLMISWAFYSVTLLLTILMWGLVMRDLTGFINIRTNIKYFCISTLGRHIPGSFWYAAGRAYLYEKEGISPAISSMAAVLEMCIAILSSVLVYAVFLPYLHVLDGNLRPELLVLVIIPAVLVMAKPSILEKATNVVLRRIRRPEIFLKVRYRSMFLWLGVNSIAWILAGGVLFTFVSAFHPLQIEAAPAMVAISAVSGLVGLLSFLAPAGFGLKEVAMAALLSAYLPFPVAVVVAVMYRLWLLICEVTWLAISLRI